MLTHSLFCFSLLHFTRRQIKLSSFSSALLHYRDCAHPIVKRSIFRGVLAFDTVAELGNTLCQMTCFQHGSLMSSMVRGIQQGILCTLKVVTVFFFLSLLSLIIFHFQSVYWLPCLFLLLNDVSMLSTTFLLCMFCNFLQKLGLLFHQWALAIHAATFTRRIWCCTASLLLKSFMCFSN